MTDTFTSTSWLLALPKEIIIDICCLLPVHNFLSVHHTCKYLWKLTNVVDTPFINKRYWKQVVYLAFTKINYSFNAKYQHINLNWHEIYQEFMVKYKKPIVSYYSIINDTIANNETALTSSIMVVDNTVNTTSGSNTINPTTIEYTSNDKKCDDSTYFNHWYHMLYFTAIKYDCPQILRILRFDKNMASTIKNFNILMAIESLEKEFEIFESWSTFEIALYFDSIGVINYFLSRNIDVDFFGNHDSNYTCHDIGFCQRNSLRNGIIKSSLLFHNLYIKDTPNLQYVVEYDEREYSLLIRMIRFGMYKYGIQLLKDDKCDEQFINDTIKDKDFRKNNLLHLACEALGITGRDADFSGEPMRSASRFVLPIQILSTFIMTLIDKMATDEKSILDLVTSKNDNGQIPLDCLISRLVSNYTSLMHLPEYEEAYQENGLEYYGCVMKPGVLSSHAVEIKSDNYINCAVNIVEYLLNKSKSMINYARWQKLILKAAQIENSQLAYKLVMVFLNHGCGSYDYDYDDDDDLSGPGRIKTPPVCCKFDKRLNITALVKNILTAQNKNGYNLFSLACQRYHLKLLLFIYDELTNVDICKGKSIESIGFSGMQIQDQDSVVINENTYPMVVARYLNSFCSNSDKCWKSRFVYLSTPYIQACKNWACQDSKQAMNVIKTLVNDCRDFVDITIGQPVELSYCEGIGIKTGSSWYKDWFDAGYYDNDSTGKYKVYDNQAWDQETARFYCWLKQEEDERRKKL